MRFLMLLLLAWIGLGLGIVHAVPARLPYEPEPPPKPVPSLELGDTTWHGTVFLAGCTIVFHRDGTLTYNGPNGSPGKWQLIGNKLKFDINNYSHYEMTVLGDEMKGTGSNQAGMKCEPHLRRVRDKKL